MSDLRQLRFPPDSETQRIIDAAAEEIERLRDQRDNLAMLVRRLCVKLGGCPLTRDAIGYVQEHNLDGSPLREEKSYGD